MTYYKNYTPDFKCSSDGNGKGVVSASVGLLTYDEVVHAGGYYNQSNSNYYLYNSAIHWWTMSPAGFTSGNSYVWNIRASGDISGNYYVANTSYHLRSVLILKSDTQISSGDGTKENPFVVE